MVGSVAPLWVAKHNFDRLLDPRRYPDGRVPDDVIWWFKLTVVVTGIMAVGLLIALVAMIVVDVRNARKRRKPRS
jgi:hypothetical protein